MPTNTSATGGYVVPSNAAIVDDDALLDLITPAIVALTQLSGDKVRPMWQQEPVNLPAPSVDWVACGIMDRNADFAAYINHVGTGNGYDQAIRTEDFTVMCVFYGNNSDRNASRVRDGFSIEQNRMMLETQGIVFIEAINRIKNAEFINKQWYSRVDMPLRFRRLMNNTFPILNELTLNTVTIKS